LRPVHWRQAHHHASAKISPWVITPGSSPGGRSLDAQAAEHEAGAWCSAPGGVAPKVSGNRPPIQGAGPVARSKSAPMHRARAPLAAAPPRRGEDQLTRDRVAFCGLSKLDPRPWIKGSADRPNSVADSASRRRPTCRGCRAGKASTARSRPAVGTKCQVIGGSPSASSRASRRESRGDPPHCERRQCPAAPPHDQEPEDAVAQPSAWRSRARARPQP